MAEQLRRRAFSCTPEVVAAWAELAHDHNPLHLDAGFAATTRFGVPIVHGHLLAAVVADEAETAWGDRLRDGGRVSVRFRAPVPVGSTIEIVTSEEDGSPSARASVDGSDVLQIGIEAAR